MEERYRTEMNSHLANWFVHQFSQALKERGYQEKIHFLAADAPQLYHFEKGNEVISLTLSTERGGQTTLAIASSSTGNLEIIREAIQEVLLSLTEILYRPLTTKEKLTQMLEAMGKVLKPSGSSKKG